MLARHFAFLGRWVRPLWSDSAIRWIVALAVAVTVVVNLPYYVTFRGLGPSKMALAIVGSAVSALFFFLLLSAHRYVLYVALPPVLAACAVAAYFLLELGVYVNENTLGLVYETTWHEASSLMSPLLVATVLATVSAGVWFAHLLAQRLDQSRVARRLGFAGLLFAAHTLVAVQTRAIEVYDPPFGFVSNSYVYFRETNRASELLRSRLDIAEGATFLSEKDKAGSNLTVVFVVGESLRPDHLHINGYPRPTTPQLEALGVLSFPDVAACATNTRYAVPCMLTRGTKAEPRLPYRETSFISVFKRMGFDTSWTSLQGRFWEAVVPNSYTVAATAAIADEAARVNYLNPSGDLHRQRLLDTELLGPLNEALAGPARRKLVVLHQIGAHFHYASHYPPEHEHYEPCLERSPRRCDPHKLNNTYDNAVHFQDHFLGQVIRRLQAEPALFFYVSDHGESLGEGGKYLHHLNSTQPEQNRAAMIVWASPAYRELFPSRWDSLQRNRTKRLAHEHVFHSVLDCAGLRIPSLDTKKSLCRDAVERREELPPNRLSVEIQPTATP